MPWRLRYKRAGAGVRRRVARDARSDRPASITSRPSRATAALREPIASMP